MVEEISCLSYSWTDPHADNSLRGKLMESHQKQPKADRNWRGKISCEVFPQNCISDSTMLTSDPAPLCTKIKFSIFYSTLRPTTLPAQHLEVLRLMMANLYCPGIQEGIHRRMSREYLEEWPPVGFTFYLCSV